MADFTALKATIQQYVKQNGNEEITGAILQDVLLSMVDTMGDGAINTLTQNLSDEITARGGADSILQGNIDSLGLSLTALATFVSSGYIFRGIANQSTVPSSLNGKVFYLTSTSGQYSNMGNITVQAGISALLYDGAAWSAVLLIAMDNAPTEDSGNMVKSGGVHSAIASEAARALAAETKSAEFDSTTKYIIFKNSAGTVLYQMDARAFVIDGMVQDVEIKAVTISGQTVTCLVISFNTDAGKQDINIPLTQIFNPANYYDKTAIDALLLPVTTRLNAGYLYMGLATVAGTPDTSKGNVFYLTATAGTYTNYGNTVVADGLTILSYDGTSWTGTLLKGLDSTPTQNSTNLVTSGGVQNELALGAVYDVSAKNPTAGSNNDGKWESLSALLSDDNLNTLIPTAVRKGGMSIKFVQSSDNKYVQYRLMADSFNTTPANWQGVDGEPTFNSNNLAKSGGTLNTILNAVQDKKNIVSGHLVASAQYAEISGGHYKAGQQIMIRVRNYSYQGSGGTYLYLQVNEANVLTINSRDDADYIYTLQADTDLKVRLYLICAAGVTTSVDVDMAIGELAIASLKAEKGYDKIQTVESNTNHINDYILSSIVLKYADGLSTRKKIIGNFKLGSVLQVQIPEYSYPSAGSASLIIQAHYTDNSSGVILQKNGRGEYTVTFTKDADYIELYLDSNGSTTTYQARVELRYGSFLEDCAQSIKATGSLRSFIQVEDKEFKRSVTFDNWLYSNLAYVGRRNAFEKNVVLKSLSMFYFVPNTVTVGSKGTLYVGTIDQRDWFLPTAEYDVEITSIYNGVITYDLKGIQVQAGQVIFMKVVGLNSGSTASLGIGAAGTNTSDNPLALINDSLLNAVSTPTYDITRWELTYSEYETIFLTAQDRKEIDSQIQVLSDTTKTINRYVDVVTDKPYKLKIANGQVIAQLLEFSKILVIGHSFVTYGNAPSADWFLPNGQNRAMAPSVYDNELAAFIAEKYGATFSKMSGVSFERSYSPNWDFATNWNIQDEWDAIVVYLCENAIYNDTMQASWEAMLHYLCSAAPHAEIYCTASWMWNGNGDKERAIAAACANVPNVTYVNLIGLYNSENRWGKGDYYIGRNDKYYPQGATDTHPSDIGHLRLANKFLEVMGAGALTEKTKNVTVNQAAGGTITVRSSEQVIGSVVSILCEGNSGKYISGMTVVDSDNNTVEATLRVNASYSNSERVYYTFIMPNKDVTITPSWSDTKNYTTYTVTVSDTTNGTIRNLNSITIAGTRVYLYAQPNSGHSLTSISAKDASNNNITLTADGENTYFFDMPASNVTVIPVWG